MKESASVTWTDPGLCTDCRACELACSFHHWQDCAPAATSISVSLDSDSGAVTLTLYAGCDLCPGEDEPLCVEFCYRGVLTRSVLAARYASMKEKEV